MPDWFIKSESREITILHPDADRALARRRSELEANGASEDELRTSLELVRKEHEIGVMLKPLNAGEVAMMREVRVGADGAGGASVAVGEAKILALELAITGWTLPVSPTRETIRQLHPLVFERIFDEIDVGEGPSSNGIGAHPTGAAEEPHPEPETEIAAATG